MNKKCLRLILASLALSASGCGVVYQLDKCLVDPSLCPTTEEPTSSAPPTSGGPSLGVLSATAISTSQIDVSWTGVSGTTVSLVIVTGSTAPTSCDDGVEIPNSSPYSVTGLDPATTYSFIMCQGTTGSYTIATNSTSATTPGIPPSSSQPATHTGGGSDGFGEAVAIYGNNALVADPWADRYSNSQGKVYAFKLSNGVWNNIQTIQGSADNPGADDGFGFSIAMLGSSEAVIGAPWRKNGVGSATPAGAAYYFTFASNTWTEKKIFKASVINEFANQDNQFGWSVALADGVILVGSPGRPITNGSGVSNANRVGEAYIYEGSGTTWSETKRLTASDGGDGDKFGYSVALSGTEAFVGSIGATKNNNDAGAVYIYEQSASWGNETKIGAGTDVKGSMFGDHMVINGSGSTLVVSDSNYDSTKGRVYIFTKTSSWGLNQTISAPTSSIPGRFGSSLALDGQELVIGAPRETSASAARSGAFYLFNSSGGNFSLVRRIRSDNPVASEYYGYALGLSQGTVLVGTHVGEEYLSGDGAAYFVLDTQVTGP